jgi:hypothetical protein
MSLVMPKATENSIWALQAAEKVVIGQSWPSGPALSGVEGPASNSLVFCHPEETFGP